MVSDKLRAIALLMLIAGAVLVAAAVYNTWQASELGGRITVLGVILNVIPGGLPLAAGITLFRKPCRATVAFWLAPLWAPLLVFAQGAAVPRPPPGFVALATAPLAYLAMLVFGRPVWKALRRFRRDGFIATGLAGAAACFLIAIAGRLLSLLLSPDGFDWFDIEAALVAAFVAPTPLLPLSAALGGAVATTYWLIVRPDRSDDSLRAVFS